MTNYTLAQKKAVYNWRSKNPERYKELQRQYSKKSITYKRVFLRELSHLGELFTA